MEVKVLADEEGEKKLKKLRNIMKEKWAEVMEMKKLTKMSEILVLEEK